ncbi:MAG: LemA family protein [Verrucomicrobiota bacterium]
MPIRSTVFLCILLVVVFAVVLIAIYNGLVAKRNRVRNAFSTIDVNLRKRHNLIPNLVETVKAYADHENETFTRVIEARNEAAAGNLSDSDRLRAEERVGPEVQNLIALAESYPDLRSSDHFLNLQRNLTEIEEQISAARRAYNAAVLRINNAVESFPSNLVANTFHFQRHDFFEAAVEARERVDVKMGG